MVAYWFGGGLVCTLCVSPFTGFDYHECCRFVVLLCLILCLLLVLLYLGSFALACGICSFLYSVQNDFCFASWRCLLRIHIPYEHWKSRTDCCYLWFIASAVFGEYFSCLYISISAIVQDPCRMGVWLGWHICYNATQVSQGQLRENRNLSSSIRAKAALIYVLSVPVHNVNQYLFEIYFKLVMCESTA